jgi:delta-aminolevulinic acid dehydratase/porphobilinogen synthase
MPNIYRYSVDTLVPFIKTLIEKGLNSILIFGIVPDELKDNVGTYAGGRGTLSIIPYCKKTFRKRVMCTSRYQNFEITLSRIAHNH